MQKKFVIIDNDVLLNDLIEEQVSIVFEKNFNIKFLKTYNINSLNVLDTIDLIIINFKFIKDNYNILINLQMKKNQRLLLFLMIMLIDLNLKNSMILILLLSHSDLSKSLIL